MPTLLFGLAVLFVYMSMLFMISLLWKNNGIADIGYGIGFLVLIASVLLRTPPYSSQVYLLAFCILIWGIRLATRIFLKNVSKPEDFRYRAWRDSWGKWFIVRSFFQIYMLQGAVIYIVALPLTLSVAFPSSQPFQAAVVLGILLWIIGFLFESIADFQLDAFIRKQENKGKIFTSGLWKYSRHPNYFGESLMWFGIAIGAYSLTSFPLLVWMGPFLITFLLLKVSGVPMLERRYEGNQEWEVYKAKTSVFIPLPPRH
jgi:steroid 5-alpha reductase family enzyme